MIARVLHRYVTLIAACAALLIGIQVPSFVDQYAKRVDAHLREVTVNFEPYQTIANKYFYGNIQKLIDLHRKSGEKSFQEEGSAIEKMYLRKQRFDAEKTALDTILPYQFIHILFDPDREILDETLAQYSYNVPLNREAIVMGVALAVAMLLALELLLTLGNFLRERFFA